MSYANKLDVSRLTDRCLMAMRRSGQWGELLRDVNAAAAYNSGLVRRVESRWVGKLWHVRVLSRQPIEGVTETVDALYFVRV